MHLVNSPSPGARTKNWGFSSSILRPYSHCSQRIQSEPSSTVMTGKKAIFPMHTIHKLKPKNQPLPFYMSYDNELYTEMKEKLR